MDDFPLVYKYIIRFLLPGGKLKVLDLGCGKGSAALALNKNGKYLFTGVDIFQSYVSECRKLGLYKKVYKKDLKKLDFKPCEYDVTLLLQVVEHMKKNDAKALLQKAAKFSKKAIIVAVPNGQCFQDEYDNNPYQKHLSTWSVADFEKMGFKVYGQGLGFVYSNESYGDGKAMALWQRILLPVSLLFSPFVFFNPKLSAQLIAVKYL